MHHRPRQVCAPNQADQAHHIRQDCRAAYPGPHRRPRPRSHHLDWHRSWSRLNLHGGHPSTGPPRRGGLILEWSLPAHVWPTSDTEWHNAKMKQLDIETWMSTTPSPKVSSSEAFKVHLTHVLRPELRVQLDFHLGKKARHHRFTGHKRRQVAVDRMCKAVLKHAPIRTDVVIAFGNASWRQGKGYASSPRRQRFARYFEQRRSIVETGERPVVFTRRRPK
ncbi:uncharacterized protein BJ171DRAFT_258619 [Polychytrium aggregatum]|uniref:uncharacterized protein n=1 Tax=Polychytrium aggregatum TaxID=110093 RepID=UPI0022FE6A2F|nr:uncharacterized protein BJ171DRAFT_258619 [Polychytrium aggregatum]KAI9207956.1 hypothetical protein BJ171DRAFT_258619 [Polychytrium aggregatum]